MGRQEGRKIGCGKMGSGKRGRWEVGREEDRKVRR